MSASGHFSDFLLKGTYVMGQGNPNSKSWYEAKAGESKAERRQPDEREVLLMESQRSQAAKGAKEEPLRELTRQKQSASNPSQVKRAPGTRKDVQHC